MNIKLVPVQMVYKVFHGTLQVLQKFIECVPSVVRSGGLAPSRNSFVRTSLQNFSSQMSFRIGSPKHLFHFQARIEFVRIHYILRCTQLVTLAHMALQPRSKLLYIRALSIDIPSLTGKQWHCNQTDRRHLRSKKKFMR